MEKQRLEWEQRTSTRGEWSQAANYHGWTVVMEPDPDYDWFDMRDDSASIWSPFYRDRHNAREWDSFDEFQEWAGQPEQKGILWEQSGDHGDEVFYITRETRWKEWGKGSKGIRQAKSCLKAEDRERRYCLNGEVYGIMILDPSGEEVDACWDFVGADYAESEALRMVKDAATYTETKDGNGYTVRTPLNV